MPKKTIVISDLHLGSDVCRADKVLSFLDEFNTETHELVLNGDVFDNLRFDRLKKSHWKILHKIRKISDHTRVVWCWGNHDRDCEIIAHLMGIKFTREYYKSYYGKHVIFTHGDQFDNFIEKYPIGTKIADFFYRMIQKFDRMMGNDYLISGKVKRNSKTFLGATKVISNNAIKFCKKKGCHAIICGHTHRYCDLTNLEQEVYYNNCGCWTEEICSYTEINTNGDIKTYEYKCDTKRSSCGNQCKTN